MLHQPYEIHSICLLLPQNHGFAVLFSSPSVAQAHNQNKHYTYNRDPTQEPHLTAGLQTTGYLVVFMLKRVCSLKKAQRKTLK